MRLFLLLISLSTTLILSLAAQNWLAALGWSAAFGWCAVFMLDERDRSGGVDKR